MVALNAGGRSIALYEERTASRGAPLVLLLTGDENGDKVWDEAHRLGTREFCMAVVPVENWENELSPWAAPRVFRGGADFGNGADDTLRKLMDTILPVIREALYCPNAPCYLAGYSLAGLFAVYALYRTEAFAGVVSASGSLWFPGFLNYAATRAPIRKPDRVYFSLGDRESRAKNPVMRMVEENTRIIYERFRAAGVDCTFELNPGNHFQDAELRLAKGIAWIIKE